MATLYAQTTQNTFSNFNWNGANDNYAWSFKPSVTGIPTSITINLAGISGTPTGNLYIKADKTAASTTYGTASSVTFTGSGDNIFTITGGSQITANTEYYVYFQRTSGSSAYPQIRYNTSLTNYVTYRSTSSNVDPSTVWFSYDITMTISGTTATNSNMLLFF